MLELQMAARHLATSKMKNVSGLPGLCKTITSYLQKPKGDDTLQSESIKGAVDMQKSQERTEMTDDSHGLNLLTVESSPIQDMGITDADADVDSDVDLESPLVSIGTDWADAIDSVSDGVSDSGSSSGMTDDSWATVVS